MGKSTAINLLSGALRPNLGDWTIADRDWDEILNSFPRGELRDYLDLLSESGVAIAVKPQYVDKLPKLWDGEVRGLLSRVDDRGELEAYAEKTAISHILDRRLSGLSGGELQRVAICATILKEADVYFFDEPSSYLDIHERMRVVRIIQNLVEMGLDMGGWNVNSPESCFVTMCSVCGSCIVKTFDDGTNPEWNVNISEWSSFFG